jgi:predicted DNA-binding transcriptional regulator YafY
MYDPIMRVLTVLEILQAREHVGGAELAERLEVNLRTVQRYITRLQDLSIPVESVRGTAGFYYLKPGFRLPPLMFTDEEAFAVALGLRALRQLGLSAFAPATEGAVAKLGRVLPPAVRESIEAVEEVVAMEAGPWVISTSAEILVRISMAIRARRRVVFDYESHTGEAMRREIEPYGVMHLDGRWYAVGRCLLRQALRTFRIDRVTRAEMADEPFERPPGFDVREYMLRSMPFVQSRFQVDIWLDLPYQEASKHFAAHRVALAEEDGGTAIRCGRDDLGMFAAMISSFRCRVIVRSPQELRDEFRALAQRALEAAGSG